MHPSWHARTSPAKPAVVMAGSGTEISYAQLEERSLRCAQLLRGLGLVVGDGIAICLDNNPRYFELCWAAQRSGLYFAPVSSKLTAPEVAYIVRDAGARVLFLSVTLRAIAAELQQILEDEVELFSVEGSLVGYRDYETTVARFPALAVPDETAGQDFLYSSGTTGRPKGIRFPLKGEGIEALPPVALLMQALWSFDGECVYLSTAPLYHSAPLRFCMAVQRLGGTCVVMERFDAAWSLALLAQYGITHSQWVPTMFVRLLKLPESERRKLVAPLHRMAVHAAAPCPRPVKRAMIEWWGPIVHEYYGGSEGNGLTAIDSPAWLAHEGSVGRPVFGHLHILDEDGAELGAGQEGTIYFGGGMEFEYHNDAARTAECRSAQGWSTIGDIGYLDQEGFLYLTDRKANMIISGGVNIYPQETENLLVTHPKVADVAVFGVPDPDFGEAVKAVVQPADMSEAGPTLEQELIAYCRAQLAHLKCPKSIDFEAELPRHPTGKLYKRLLRDRYWTGHQSRIV